MDYGPLVTEDIVAGAELAREFDQYKPLKAGEDDSRDLYLTSDEIKDTDVRAAYGEIHRLLCQPQSPEIDPFRIKIIKGTHPLAIAAAKINEKFPSTRGRHLGGQMFGGIFVEELYLYPSPLPVAV